VRKPDHWHPCLLADDYLKKLRQDLSESDAVAESATCYDPKSTLLPATTASSPPS